MKAEPTFTCFTDAAEFVNECVRQNPALAFGTSIHLVHGILMAPERDDLRDRSLARGQRYAHAWVEQMIDGRVYAIHCALVEGVKTYIARPLEEFYEVARVAETTRYTMREVLTHNLRTGHVGPWEPAYVPLCRQHDVSECVDGR